MSCNDFYSQLPVIDRYKEWLKNNTTLFEKIDTVKSKKLAKYCKIKECYANAARNSFGNLQYYEGFVKTGVIDLWIEHAFLVNKHDQSVVDPTLAIISSEPELTQCKYIGMKFKNPIVKMAKTKTFTPLLLDYFIRNGRKNP